MEALERGSVGACSAADWLVSASRQGFRFSSGSVQGSGEMNFGVTGSTGGDK